MHLRCPSLEELKLNIDDLDARCLTNLNDTCPALKSLIVKWSKEDNDEELTQYALDIVHENLEMLRLYNMWTIPIEQVFTHRTLPRVVCPNLRRLVLRGYTNVLHLPSILRTLPGLEGLLVTLMGTHWPKVELEHQQLQILYLGHGTIDRLVISMPKLKTLHLDSCMVEESEVASKEVVNLKSTQSFDPSSVADDTRSGSESVSSLDDEVGDEKG